MGEEDGRTASSQSRKAASRSREAMYTQAVAITLALSPHRNLILRFASLNRRLARSWSGESWMA